MTVAYFILPLLLNLDLSPLVSSDANNVFIPHEYAYLNHSVLSGSHGYSVPSGHTHFTLKKKPQASVQLRNEILQRGECDY